MDNRIVYESELSLKLLENFKFKYHKNFDISKISQEILNFDAEWYIDTSRQSKYPAHSKTFSYFCYNFNELWQKDQKYELTSNLNNLKILELVEPIVKDLELTHNGKRGKVVFIKLPAGCHVDTHRDRGYYLSIIRRHHIPIISNDSCMFEVEYDNIVMEEGECWEINNSRYHFVNNTGSTDRVHLMIDIIPDNFIN